MEPTANDFPHINGWGIDADPKNEPTYPMKKYTGDDHERLNYQRPPLQPVDIEVLHSNERPNITAVFGTVSPPSGLSGVMRRKAFEYSENNWGHWLWLLAADRVNAIEGIVDDLKSGHVPNVFAERGLKAEWQYNKKGLVKKAVVVLAVSIIAGSLLSRKKKRSIL